MKEHQVLLIISVLFVMACGENSTDLDKPGLSFVRLDPNPTEGLICGYPEDSVFHLTGGTSLEMRVQFRDNVGLSQYKIDIHHNFDCHGHGGSISPGFTVPGIINSTEDFSVLKIETLGGTVEEVDEMIPVPSNVTAGVYHFQIQVIDEAGNDDPQAHIYSLRVYHPLDQEPPVLEVDSPMGDLMLKKGTSTSFSGQVLDNYSLWEGGNGVLFLTYTDLTSGNTFLTDVVIPFDSGLPDAKRYEFTFDYTAPMTLKAGPYIFSLRAHDGVRNVGEAVSFTVNLVD